MSPKIGIGDHVIGIGNRQIARGGAGNKKKVRAGLRVRLTAIPGLTPKKILREPLRFQVIVSPDWEDTRTALFSDFETVGAGQFSSPAGGDHAPQLRELSFESLTLDWEAKWLVYPETSPEEVREELEAILESRQPVELFAHVGPGGSKVEARMMVTLRAMTRILRHGENDTRYFNLEWKQFRDATMTRKGGNRYSNLPTQYTLKKDDTLRSIADHFYGVESMWEFLAASNGIKGWGGDDPLVKMGRYKVGDKIKILAPPPSAIGPAQPLTGKDNHLRVGGK
jgi:hypothetical protein